MAEETLSVHEFKLEQDWELRFEVENKSDKVMIELKTGLAEVFGTELVKGKKYEFGGGAKVAVNTYHGCTVELTGKTDVSYTAKETPNCYFLNCHLALETMRNTAEKNDVRGPITMVVGPNDVGKSTLCRILLNYAVRMGRKPTFVDLDVGDGHIAIPGTIGALLIERTAEVGGGFSQQAPLCFHFGHKTPAENLALYDTLVSRLAEVWIERSKAKRKSKTSGIIINTCGWVKDGGYKILTNAARAFEVDVILVLDQERLYNELVRDIPDFVKVIFLPKSGGVVVSSATQRTEVRDRRVREYFYGSKTPLYPHSFEVKWSEARIYKIGAPVLPASCMPLGMKAEDNLTKLVAVSAGPNLLHHILAISFATSIDDDVVQTNVAGFVCVTNVDIDRQTITVLSPQPRPLPNTILLLSDIQFMDSH